MPDCATTSAVHHLLVPPGTAAQPVYHNDTRIINILETFPCNARTTSPTRHVYSPGVATLGLYTMAAANHDHDGHSNESVEN